MKGRITLVGIVQFLFMLWLVLRMIFAPLPAVQAQGPIGPENWHEYIADGATVVAQGQYSTIFDYVRAFGPAASGYSYRAANGWGFAVGFDPVQAKQTVQVTQQILRPPTQPTQEFVPGWNAYSGAAYWMARHGGQLPPPSVSTWYSSAIPMFGGLTTTNYALQMWWLRASGGAGTWQW